jgi:hypothetical protein
LWGTTTDGGWSGNTGCLSVEGKAVNLSSSCGSGQYNWAANLTNTGGYFAGFYYNTSTLVGTITTNGTGTTYGSSSDARLKENISDAGDAGSIIDSLKVRQWDWKVNGSHEDFGFIAQEEYEVYPNAVVAGDDGADVTRQWSRDDSKLVPLLVKEIQSLRQRIAVLENN